MYKPLNKKTASLFICLLMLLTSFTANGEEDNDLLANLFNYKIEQYRQLYPEILFMVLKGGDEALADMGMLDMVLGYQPVSLDYDHPPELREALMYVNVERIFLMLQLQMPSASLFKADQPLGWQENVCVLTIDPANVAGDSVQATNHLLNFPPEVIQKIPEKLKLQPRDYLEFVIDHEIYHCLQSLYMGPQVISDKEFWAEYNHLHDEFGADAYALAMHIKKRGQVSSFVENINRIRGMSLYNADPEHLTSKAFDQVLKIPVKTLVKMTSKEVFNVATGIKESLTTSYAEYMKYLVSAVEAIKAIGVISPENEALGNAIKNFQPDQDLVRELVNGSQRCLAELRGDDLQY